MSLERAPDVFDDLGWVSADDVDAALRRYEDAAALHPAGAGGVDVKLGVAHLRAGVRAGAVVFLAALAWAVAAPVLSAFAVVAAAAVVAVGAPLTLRWHRRERIAAYEAACDALPAPPRLGGVGGESTPAALPTSTTPT